MADILQHRKGSTVTNDLFTGALSEITHDMESQSLRIHDGAKQGGYEVGMPQAKGIIDLRSHTPTASAFRYLKYRTTAGDSGHGVFRAVAGKPAGYFTAGTGTVPDNNGTIIVPTGGNGSSAWVREDIGYVTPEMFGAVGDGVVDDTVALSSMVSAHANYKGVRGKVYTSNNPITLPSNSCFDLSGASIKAGAAKTGLLLTGGNLFYQFNTNNVKIKNGTLLPSSSAYVIIPGSNSVVLIRGTSTYCSVENCDITVTGVGVPLTDFTNGIALMDAASHCSILRNKIIDGGIRYSNNSGSYNTVSYNTVTNSGIAGRNGFSLTPQVGHIVSFNTVINPVSMGIEEQSITASNFFIIGTKIVHNTIIGNAITPAMYFAISAVADSPIVSNNTILNWGHGYAIEVLGSQGANVSGNVIEWNDGNPNDVHACQSQIPKIATGRTIPVQFDSNTIIGASSLVVAVGAIHVRGAQAVKVTNNIFRGCVGSIFVQDQGASTTIFSNNIIETTTMGLNRQLIWCGINSIYANNKFSYLATLTGGLQTEVVFISPRSNSTFDGNIIETNGIVNNGGVSVFNSNGSVATGCKFINNTATTPTTGNMVFNSLPIFDNNTNIAVTSALTAKGFYTTAPITRPTAVPITAAGLHAALVSLGLIA